METGKNNTNSKSRGKFKSYYVVWKLSDENIKKSEVASLNRTMQYGNEYRTLHYIFPIFGLNRTMQYGN